MSKISKLTNELKRNYYRPAQDISSLESLGDNFIYSILLNTQYRQEIEGFSPVELSNWLKQHPQLQSDYDVLQLIFGL